MLTINYLTKASTHCAGTIYACQRGLFSIPSVLPGILNILDVVSTTKVKIKFSFLQINLQTSPHKPLVPRS